MFKFKAHKAKGKFSFCEVIREINAIHQNFRVVALSATPGKADDVVQVVKNLLISKIEMRSERCRDVAKYTFKKEILIEKVRLGFLENIRDEFMTIVEPYLRKLVEFKAITGSNISKGWIAIQQRNFAAQSHPNRKEIMSLFSLVQSLVYSLELLERHGINLFLDSFKDENNVTKRKYFISQDRNLKVFIDKLDEQFKDKNPLKLNVNPLPNGIIPEINCDDLNFGHPKYEVLKNLITDFFESGGSKTIIFCEYRDTVKLIYILLLQLRPQILPRMLIGQGGAISQKDQLQVMKEFRSNKVNVLITTSVCEEGIDVGDVDLVICFDINSKNGTRFVQRIGRTGRKRNGKVRMLATQGKEEEAVRAVIGTKDKLNRSITTNNQIKEALFKTSPRLIPPELLPTCIETRIKIPTKEEEKEEAKKSTRKSKKSKSTSSIASHFERVPRNKKIEMETLADIAPEPIIPDISIEQNFDSLEQDFKDKVTEILSKVPNSLLQHLKLSTEEDLKFFGKLRKVFNEPAEEVFTDLNFDFLDSNHDVLQVIHLENIKSQPRKNFTIDESQTIQLESRYGNQFSIPEPFNTPFAISPFQQVKSKLFTPKESLTTSTPLTSKGKRKRSLVSDESPLLKAFERQRNINASSTPSNRFQTTRESPIVQNKSVVESSVIESSITFPTSTNILLKKRKRKKPAKNALEFFNLKSIDDIFEQTNNEDVFDENATPDIPMTDVNFFDDDDELIMQMPEISKDDEIIESSLSPKDIIESSILPKLVQPKKIRKRENRKFDFNIDEIFGNAPSSNSSYKENVASPLQNENVVEQKEETKVENSTVTIALLSPVKSTDRVRPNFARLTRALRSPNFHSPSQNSTEKTIEKTTMETSFTNKTMNNLTHFESPKRIDSSRSSTVSLRPSTSSAIPPTKRKITKKRPRRDFLDTQAGVDGTDSEDEDEIDESLMGFIANETTIDSDHDETIDMQAQYLKSLRSPSTRRYGGFKMPNLPPLPKNFDIFSQDPRLDEDDDENDEDLESFIVSNSQEHTLNDTLDELEIAERILKKKRKDAKRGVKRRKIIRSINDSSDDDDGELEELRKQLKHNPD